MRIDEIMNQWKSDCVINQLRLDEEMLRTPKLHSTYLTYYMEYKSKYFAAVKELNREKNVKRRYYRGELDKEELLANGLVQWQGLKPTITELNLLFETDKTLNDLQERVNMLATAVSSIEYIMRAIQSRGYDLKSLLEYRKFMDGS